MNAGEHILILALDLKVYGGWARGGVRCGKVRRSPLFLCSRGTWLPSEGAAELSKGAVSGFGWCYPASCCRWWRVGFFGPGGGQFLVGQCELVLRRGFGEVARGAFVGDVDGGRVVDALAIEEFGDSQDLQARVIPPGRFVEACGGGLRAHRLGGLFESNENADLCLLALDDTAQVSNIFDADVAGFDGENDLLRFAAFFVVKVEASVDALVRAFLLLDAACADQAESPPLELEWVLVGEFVCVGNGNRLADDLVGFGDLVAEGVAEAAFDEADGKVGDVDADPVSFELLCDGNGGAAAAEGVEDGVAFVTAGFDDSFEQGLGLLGWVAETFGGLRVDWRNIGDDVLLPRPFAQEAFESWESAATWSCCSFPLRIR